MRVNDRMDKEGMDSDANINLLQLAVLICGWGLVRVQMSDNSVLFISVEPIELDLGGDSFTIQSPLYPNLYPNNAFKLWSFVADSGVYHLIVNTFNLENNYDYLYIGTGTFSPDTLLYSFNEFYLPEFIITNSSIWLLFDSDYSVQYDGFEIVISLIGEYMIFK